MGKKSLEDPYAYVRRRMREEQQGTRDTEKSVKEEIPAARERAHVSVLAGAIFLQKFDEVHAKKGNQTIGAIAKETSLTQKIVRRFVHAPDFSPEMREIIARKNLGNNAAITIFRFPHSLHAPLADAYAKDRLFISKLRYALYWSAEGRRSLRSLLEEMGFAWPKDLNDDGAPL